MVSNEPQRCSCLNPNRGGMKGEVVLSPSEVIKSDLTTSQVSCAFAVAARGWFAVSCGLCLVAVLALRANFTMNHIGKHTYQCPGKAIGPRRPLKA